MHGLKISIFLLYITVTLIPPASCGICDWIKRHCCCSGCTSCSSCGSSKKDDEVYVATPKPPPPEVKLELKDLTEEHGLRTEVDLDGWKIVFFRFYIGHNYNKLVNGECVIWPELLAKQSMYEILMLIKETKYLISLASIKPDGSRSNRYIVVEQMTESSTCQIQYPERGEFLEKLNQELSAIFHKPYPEKLVKHHIFQNYLHFYEEKKGPEAAKKF